MGMKRIKFTPSASKHGIDTMDAAQAMRDAVVRVALREDEHETLWLFIGHPHPQALEDDWLEVLAAEKSRMVVVFHVMRLSDVYRHHLTNKEQR